MKAVEKVIGISLNDLQVALPALTSGYQRLAKDYIEKTHPKLKILD